MTQAHRYWINLGLNQDHPRYGDISHLDYKLLTGDEFFKESIRLGDGSCPLENARKFNFQEEGGFK